VKLFLSDTTGRLSVSAKICIYRFIQEALNNGFRHGGGVGQKVRQTLEKEQIVVEVEDEGPGFDPETPKPGRLGLTGLRERIESLGGTFLVRSSKKETVVRMSIRIEELEEPV
jgi:signal transduction histidine kinase